MRGDSRVARWRSMRQLSPMMRIAYRFVLASLLLALAACGMLPPYETVPPPLKRGEQNPGQRVSVCYNPLTTTTEKVRALAAESCGTGMTPKPIEGSIGLNSCPLLIPERGTFLCTAP